MFILTVRLQPFKQVFSYRSVDTDLSKFLRLDRELYSLFLFLNKLYYCLRNCFSQLSKIVSNLYFNRILSASMEGLYMHQTNTVSFLACIIIIFFESYNFYGNDLFLNRRALTQIFVFYYIFFMVRYEYVEDTTFIFLGATSGKIDELFKFFGRKTLAFDC